MIPFVGIKLIDLVVAALGLAREASPSVLSLRSRHDGPLRSRLSGAGDPRRAARLAGEGERLVRFPGRQDRGVRADRAELPEARVPSSATFRRRQGRIRRTLLRGSKQGLRPTRGSRSRSPTPSRPRGPTGPAIPGRFRPISSLPRAPASTPTSLPTLRFGRRRVSRRRAGYRKRACSRSSGDTSSRGPSASSANRGSTSF